MNTTFAVLLQNFFVERLQNQRHASPHTITAYRDTFRLLLRFVKEHLHKAPSVLRLEDLDAPLIGTFLDHLEKKRHNSAKSCNLRLTVIRSFFEYVAFQEPALTAQIQRILAIPSKRYDRAVIDFLTPPEIQALLDAPDTRTWIGRRDHALLALAIQAGLRLSELTSLRQEDLSLMPSAHVRCLGKGRKERCTPLTRKTAAILKIWIKEQSMLPSQILFPSARGGRLSSDAVQALLAKYVGVAEHHCPSLKQKNVTPHVLRHTTAMELLQAGVDRSVIALWLGHESPETTQIYLDAHLALKEQALAKTTQPHSKFSRFRPDDQLLQFLQSL